MIDFNSTSVEYWREAMRKDAKRRQQADDAYLIVIACLVAYLLLF